jgi:hypothetical protein
MIKSSIKITGPGLCINGPALVVIEALRKAGYIVQFEEWDGLDQWDAKDRQESINGTETIVPYKIDVEVRPQPWGG